MEEVKTKDTDTAFLDSLTPSQQCTLCHSALARYTCPRCNVRYCTLECYRCEGHAQCSELFYRDCFVDGLRGMEADSEEKKRMMEMLQRIEEQDVINNESNSGDADHADSEEEKDDLTDELAGLDLDKASDVDIWKRLPEAEKREFAAMLKDGRIGELVPIWDPWWLSAPRLITELDASSSGEIPPILAGYEDMGRSLGKNTRLSTTIRYGIIASLYAYAYVARLYNGDHASTLVASECSHVILAMVTDSPPTNDVSSAIAGCLKSIERLEAYFVTREFSISVIADVAKIVASQEHVLAALSDCHAMMILAKKDMSGVVPVRRNRRMEEDTGSQSDPQVVAAHGHRCFQVVKKLEFYLAWMFSHGDVLCALAPVVTLEHYSLASELASYDVDRANVEKLLAEKNATSSRKLIEEMDCV